MKKKNQGFTLVEILIVVVILGILAAIVIPQFSDASTQSKVSSAASSIQTMRSQISLYKIQHNDTAPTLLEMNADVTTPGSSVMTGQTDELGAAGTEYGPYLQSIPANPFNGKSTLAANSATGNGWIYTVDANQNVTITLDDFDITSADVVDDLQLKGVVAPD